MIELTEDPNPRLLQRFLRWLLPRAARFDRYNEAARESLFFARQAVSELGGHCLEPEHLTIGLLTGHPEVVTRFLDRAGSLEALIRDVRDTIKVAERVAESVEVPFSKATVRVLRKSMDEAGGVGGKVVRPEHLLLGVLSEAGNGAVAALRAHGVKAADVRRHISTV